MISVAIIGSGPVGLTLALDLQRRGIDFIILEKDAIDLSTGFGFVARGLAVSSRSCEILEEYPEVFEQISKNVMSSISKFEVENGASFSLYEGLKNESKYGPILCIPQSKVREILIRQLQSKGIRVMDNSTLKSVLDCGDYVKLEYFDKDNNLVTIDAKYLAACDGAKSLVRKSLGISYDGNTHETSSVSVVCEVEDRSKYEDGKFLIKQDGAPSFWIPLSGNTIGMISNLDLPEEQEWLSDECDGRGYKLPKPLSPEQFQRVFDNRNSGLQIKKVLWSTHFRINNRLSSKYWNSNRVFLVGDAAHSSDPFIGLGQNVGIQDAHNLAWKLAFVLQNKIDVKVLSSYHQERHGDGRVLMKQVVANDALIYMNPILKRCFAIASKIQSLQSPSLLALAKLSYQYKSDICVGETKNYWLWDSDTYLTYLNAGHRFPPNLLDKIHPGFLQGSLGFKLLVFSARNQDQFLKEAKNISKGIISNSLAINEEHVKNRCGIVGEAMMLIRPDGHIGLRKDEICLNLLKEYLRNHLGAEIVE